MASLAPLNWGRILLSGLTSGIAGGICYLLFLVARSFVPGQESLLTLLQFSASTAFGKAAYGDPWYAWAGIFMLLAGCVGWAIGYAYLAHSRPAINKQPLISGFVFGVIIYVVMQFVLFSVQALKVPDVLSVYLGLLGSTVFYGIPVAYAARVK